MRPVSEHDPQTTRDFGWLLEKLERLPVIGVFFGRWLDQVEGFQAFEHGEPFDRGASPEGRLGWLAAKRKGYWP